MKTIFDEFQPKNPLWPEKDFLDLPVVKPILTVKNRDSYLQRLYSFIFKRTYYIVIEDYFTYIHKLDGWMWCPKNFVYDFASIPKIIPLVNPVGVFAHPALPHDFCYRFKCLLISKGPGEPFIPVTVTRKEADEIFFDMAKRSNNLVILDCVATLILRAVGWYVFNPKSIYHVDWNKEVQA